ncbi:Nucleolysin TIAR [Talaromyces islandicus]|uniref:Nucleolysin TIAR n=1 Tax=Talaromyces islandicus TaxID=28573 RepID=A0A0U1LJ80_TALIS|nr:Nucleolysin TIAR [Talaromyces islandicus]
MAENAPPASSATLPPPPQPSAGAPGQAQFDSAQNNGQGAGPHMPPPPSLPSVVIPQNTNPIPTAITSPMSGNMMSPTSAGGYVRRAAPEPNKRALYVGGLDGRVTEDILKQIFETTGHVQSVKIIPDKNFQSKGLNYGFVEYDDPGAAERAMQTLNGRRIHQSEIRVNWAYQANSSQKEDTSNHFHIFVGDLSNEVNDEVLLQAFSAFGSVSEARVMWDMKTGRSRGYGFVAFREFDDAEKALKSMDREWLGSRAIRCNWANQKGQPSISQQQAMAAMGMTPPTPFGHHHFPTHGIQSYDMVAGQTPQWQTTCYVGNLTPYTTQNDLVPLFQNFGYVVETRLQADRGFAFLKMDSHENAAMAICQLNGYQVNGRPLKCSWGKDRPPTGQFDGFQAQQSTGGPGFNATPYFPQYGGPMSPQGPAPAGRGWDQQGNNFAGGAVPGQAFQGPAPAAGYGRGQNASGANWQQQQQQQPQQQQQQQPGNANFGNGFGQGGYQA